LPRGFFCFNRLKDGKFEAPGLLNRRQPHN
jgi:hypothetical protein